MTPAWVAAVPPQRADGAFPLCCRGPPRTYCSLQASRWRWHSFGKRLFQYAQAGLILNVLPRLAFTEGGGWPICGASHPVRSWGFCKNTWASLLQWYIGVGVLTTPLLCQSPAQGEAGWLQEAVVPQRYPRQLEEVQGEHPFSPGVLQPGQGTFWLWMGADFPLYRPMAALQRFTSYANWSRITNSMTLLPCSGPCWSYCKIECFYKWMAFTVLLLISGGFHQVRVYIYYANN